MNQDSVPERLRRWTRNPLGSARRGSNPLAVASLLTPGQRALQGPGADAPPLKAPGGRKRRVPSAAPYWNAVWRAAGNQDRASKRRAGRARAAALISVESRVELLLKTVCPSG